jgi:hypothetical protein
MMVSARSRWKLPGPWTAQNAAHRPLENAGAFSTSLPPALKIDAGRFGRTHLHPPYWVE